MKAEALSDEEAEHPELLEAKLILSEVNSGKFRL